MSIDPTKARELFQTILWEETRATKIMNGLARGKVSVAMAKQQKALAVLFRAVTGLEMTDLDYKAMTE